eukprot:TRINITY_DN5612_c0_g1_i1.p1 TRINITY_DN5612_c0_g1~~TRINITY_DN5612_c0_g1_i1.p1  ORF type:complete len:472 (-),score=128.20 TRINITY_DN5612_c0_g1_i1:46-1461(-)
MVASGEDLRLQSTPEQLESLQSLQASLENDLQRSQRVQEQLRAVLLALQRRCDELTAGNGDLHLQIAASDPLATACLAMERDVQATAQCLEQLLPRTALLTQELEEEVLAGQTSKADEARYAVRLTQAIQRGQLLAAECSRAELRTSEAQGYARSMVSEQVLENASAVAEKLRGQLCNSEAESARLRQSLADSWAPSAISQLAPDDNAQIRALDEMEEELTHLADTQRQASSDAARVQRLERSEAALQQRLRQVSEEKASLQSARVDLGDAGRAMREAMASQSEGYMRHLGGLEQARRSSDVDRKRLIQECATLQSKLDDLAPKLVSMASIQGRFIKLEATCRVVSVESQRLRDVNSALGAQLLRDDLLLEQPDRSPEGESEEVFRVLKLRQKLFERQESQDSEREQLAEQIRGLERAAARRCEPEPSPPVAPTVATKKAPAASAVPASLASARTSVQNGLRKFRAATIGR